MQWALSMFLGSQMILFGLSKLMRYQFQVSAEHYAKPLSEVSGATLTWVYLSARDWFQVFIGAAEFVPAVLLFHRRTRLVGALLMLPVISNVMLFNHAHDLWDRTKASSTKLFVITLIIILIDWRRIRAAFQRVLGPASDGPATLWAKLERTTSLVIGVASLGLAVLTITSLSAEQYGRVGDFVGGRRQLGGAGTFAVSQVLVDGERVPEASVGKMYFGHGSRLTWLAGDMKQSGSFDANREGKTFRIGHIEIAGSKAPLAGIYEGNFETDLILRAERGGQTIELQLERLPLYELRRPR